MNANPFRDSGGRAILDRLLSNVKNGTHDFVMTPPCQEHSPA